MLDCWLNFLRFFESCECWRVPLGSAAHTCSQLLKYVWFRPDPNDMNEWLNAWRWFWCWEKLHYWMGGLQQQLVYSQVSSLTLPLVIWKLKQTLTTKSMITKCKALTKWQKKSWIFGKNTLVSVQLGAGLLLAVGAEWFSSNENYLVTFYRWSNIHVTHLTKRKK